MAAGCTVERIFSWKPAGSLSSTVLLGARVPMESYDTQPPRAGLPMNWNTLTSPLS
jgi:hypothetical protein